jgi:hypothetical protein
MKGLTNTRNLSKNSTRLKQMQQEETNTLEEVSLLCSIGKELPTWREHKNAT